MGTTNDLERAARDLERLGLSLGQAIDRAEEAGYVVSRQWILYHIRRENLRAVKVAGMFFVGRDSFAELLQRSRLEKQSPHQAENTAGLDARSSTPALQL